MLSGVVESMDVSKVVVFKGRRLKWTIQIYILSMYNRGLLLIFVTN